MSDSVETYEDWTEEQFVNLLSDKEQAFCRAYVISFNKAKAARAAGYSVATAKEQGYHIFTKLHIRAYVDHLVSNLVNDYETGVQRVLREYCKIAYYDHRELYDEEGHLRHPTDLPDDLAAAVTSVKVEVIGVFGKKPPKGEPDNRPKMTSIEYKLSPRKDGLDAIAKFRKMFGDKMVVVGDPSNPISHKHDMTDEVKELMGEIYDASGSK